MQTEDLSISQTEDSNIMQTEDLNPKSVEIDALSINGIVEAMEGENAAVFSAVRAARHSISKAVEDVVAAIRAGGSLVYVGAGTSGRLGVLDASEMPPTFNVAPGLVRAIMAGGQKAVTTSVEGAEDCVENVDEAIDSVTEKDVLIGITASGTACFVLESLRKAKLRGTRTWLLTCNDVTYDFPDGTIYLPTGPEIVAGSTRLKAGTATKIALNTISTAAMIRLGRVYCGFMVDVVPSNDKLKRRAIRIIKEIAGVDDRLAVKLLAESGGNAKTAILMHLRGATREQALARLDLSGGSLREALALGRKP
ncbi:MAG: N-acetylmuramic acid 6-phosphate etherase [Nitrospirae bacterium]|nr:N-acetylmuramic acid 6-phosphate etherase [Nitrospirota bacterium]